MILGGVPTTVWEHMQRIAYRRPLALAGQGQSGDYFRQCPDGEFYAFSVGLTVNK